MIFGGGGGDRLFSNDEFSFTYWDDRTLTDPASYLDGGNGNDEIEFVRDRLSPSGSAAPATTM